MPTRRAFLGSLAATACAASATPGDSGPAPGPPADPGDDTPLEPITPNAEFYRVAISGYTPTEEALAAWTLTLADEDGQTVVLAAADVAALAGTDEERTISCIGGSSSRTVGNAVWTGLRLDELFDAVGFHPDERFPWVRFTSGDGYATTLPRADLDAGLRLVWGMNGEALPADHGAPFRALVPGRYGMKNPKWIQRIELVEELEAGFWESRGWSQDAEYQVMSWFVQPYGGAQVTDEGAWLKGLAFAGEAGITKVELSDDDGATWTKAEITYAGGPGVWTLWRLRWVPPAAGTYTIVVRATAADGRVQAATEVYDADLDGLEAFDSLIVAAG